MNCDEMMKCLFVSIRAIRGENQNFVNEFMVWQNTVNEFMVWQNPVNEFTVW